MTSTEHAPKPEPGTVEVTLSTTGPPVVSLRGECDLTTRDALTQALKQSSDQPGPVVLVDLSGCSFIDSTVIGAIALAHRTLGDQGRRIELVIPPERQAVRRIIELSGLEAFFSIHESLPAADH
jgi:anti-anti-sigma factor